ncbi:hypothetical protein [Nocardia sp. NBC_00403]|uniref:hypothetical protein n=1 Tax=Nocardia sp. NBC_00403 TaxID=2975990 RepID=UPI002E20B499
MNELLKVGLGRFGVEATRADKARALSALIELSVATNESARGERWRTELRAMKLSEAERMSVAKELRAATDLADWLSEES